MAQANVKLTVDATSATRALQGVQNQTNQLQKAFGGLKTAIAGIGLTVLAKQTISTTANFKTLQLRMEGLTSEYGEFAQVQELVTKAQDKFNLSIVEATKSVTDIFARLRPLGIELKDIETAFMGFNTLAVAAGLNANEMNAAFTQLAQGLGSGQLQGDEFRSIAEQIPQLLSAISKETGIAEGKLKTFASKGLLKTDIIIKALANSTEEYQDVVEEIINNSPEAAFKAFSNAALELQLTLGDKLIPTVVKITEVTTAFVKAINRFIDSDIGKTSAIFAGIALAFKATTTAANLLAAAKTILVAKFAATSIGAIALAKANATAALSTKALAISTGLLTIALNALPVIALASGFAFLTNAIISSINKQKEFNRIMEEGSVEELQGQLDKAVEKYLKLEEELDRITKSGNFVEKLFEEDLIKAIDEAGDKINEIVNKITEVQDESKESLFKDEVKDLKNINKSLKDREELLKLGTEEEREREKLKQKMDHFRTKFAGMDLKELETLIKDNQQLEKSIKNLERKEEAAKALQKRFEQIGKSIEDGIVSNLADAVEGTKTLADAAINVLNKLKRKLIEVAIQRAISGLNIGGNIGDFLKDVFKAEGGPVNRGRSYIVGERGPEMFVPNTSGTIVPNNSLAMGGGGVTNVITVNVDSSSSDVQSNDGQANQFGEALAAAIQAELINQKRAGGLLSNA